MADHRRQTEPEVRKMSYVVFVDLDNTLLSTSSAVLIVRHLLATGRLGYLSVAALVVRAVLCTTGITSPAAFFAHQARRLAGVSEDTLGQFHRAWFHEVAMSHIRSSMVAELVRHRALGARLVLLSAAPQPTCEPFLHALRLDSAVCTTLEFEEGTCSGRFVGRYCHGMEKVRRALSYLEENGLSLAGSFFYGDSYAADGPMLRRVDNPICVSPERQLLKLARRMRWPVIAS